MNKKYQLNTVENKAFLDEICKTLLAFGHNFPSPGGASYYLGDDGIRRTGWQTINGKKYYLSDTGAMFTGWLGALVNTWQPGQTLKGNPADAADINANNYMYEVVAVGDYNGDGTDDVMLQNIMPASVNGITITGSGDVFTFLTGNIDAVKNGVSPIVAYAGCASGGWKIAGSGDFDGDGTTDTLLSDGTGIAGWKMIAGQRAGDQWFGTLAAGQEIAGIADLNNDGTDDILLCDRTTGIYSGWLVQNGAVTGTLAIA